MNYYYVKTQMTHWKLSNGQLQEGQIIMLAVATYFS